MAAKDLKAGDKRKAASGSKGKPDGKVKKARLGDSKPLKKAAAKEESDDFEDFSDSDDGGAKLDTDKADNKAAKKTEGSGSAKEFDRSKLSMYSRLALGSMVTDREQLA